MLRSEPPRMGNHTEDGRVFLIFHLGARPQNGAEIVIVDRLLIGHHEFPPPLLASLTLHLVLVDRDGGVEVGEILLQMLVDVVIVFGQAQGRALDLGQDRPVCFEMLDS